ncbi:hypothetical protein AB0J72_16340 [Dactylosporangium sp. NPDC049742]|uniref:hypothetical protein n=1 Tax=Dactylosporangium sp. NPDC049742 TaxID=3154737 RepID=UPI00341E1CED
MADQPAARPAVMRHPAADSCCCQNRANRPPAASSSSTGPSSTTRPSSIRTTRSAWRMLPGPVGDDDPGARHRVLDGYRQLLAALRRRSPIALAQLSSRPALIDGLFFHARRGDLRRELQPFADRLRKRSNPVTRALASLHPDGHVREAAVSAMVERPRPEYVPFLAERAVEWVEPVRRRALAGLHKMLTEQPARYRPLVARELPRFAARRHGPALAALLDQVSVSRTG